MKVKNKYYFLSLNGFLQFLNIMMIYFIRSNIEIRFPTGLNNEFPSGVNNKFPWVYTVPHKLENLK